MTGLETGIGTLLDVVFNTYFIDNNWITNLTIIFASMLIITRQWKDWTVLFLPVALGWSYFGMHLSSIVIMFATIIFIIDVLSVQLIGKAFTTVREPGFNLMSKMFGAKKIKKPKQVPVGIKLNVSEEMEKLLSGPPKGGE